MTIRESILAAFQTALTGTTGVQGVYRSRVQALNQAEHPSIIIEPVSDLASHNSIPRVTWDLIVLVTLLVRDDNPDNAADSILADMYSRIMTNSAIDNIAVDRQPIKTDFQFLDGDNTLGVITNQFKVTYQTALNDLTST